MKQFACQVIGIDRFVGDVYRVMLRMPAGTVAEFSPGQYLSLNIEGIEPAFFSIASQPGGRDIELHIKAPANRPIVSKIFSYLEQNPVVQTTQPYGKACLSAFYAKQGKDQSLDNTEIILVAAGTGFAQIKAIAQALLSAPDRAKAIHLFWGGRTLDDLYDLAEPERWQSASSHFYFHIVTADSDDDNCSKHHDLLVAKVVAQAIDYSSAAAFVSGSPGLVYNTLDSLLAIGMNERNFYSDVLEYAPRT